MMLVIVFNSIYKTFTKFYDYFLYECPEFGFIVCETKVLQKLFS